MSTLLYLSLFLRYQKKECKNYVFLKLPIKLDDESCWRRYLGDADVKDGKRDCVPVVSSVSSAEDRVSSSSAASATSWLYLEKRSIIITLWKFLDCPTMYSDFTWNRFCQFYKFKNWHFSVSAPEFWFWSISALNNCKDSSKLSIWP